MAESAHYRSVGEMWAFREQLKAQRKAGKSLREIGDEVGLSREGVRRHLVQLERAEAATARARAERV